MPFEKGISGNPLGRPKGSIDRSSQLLKECIKKFLLNEFEIIKKDFNQLPPKDRVRLYIDLLAYTVPKVQSVEFESGFESLPDDQLDYIIENLKNPKNEKGVNQESEN
ncbi:MAG: hypothetical protein FJX80_10090 [Bacteroidetes bacterium]|nr:hypothetical protein [Bacteroidota bacterium]